MGETINNQEAKGMKKKFLNPKSLFMYDLIRLQTSSSLSHLSSFYPRSNLLSHFVDWKES